MEPIKGDDQPKRSKADRGEDQLMLEEFADSIAEAMKERQGLEKLEPFDLYAYQLKSHLQGDIKVFKNRFIKGYEVLMEVLGRGLEE